MNKEHNMRSNVTSSNWFRILAFVVGVSYGIWFTLRFPEVFLTSTWNGFPHWISVLMVCIIFAERWPWGLLTVGALIVITLRTKSPRQTCVLIFAIGALIGHLIIGPWH